MQVAVLPPHLPPNSSEEFVTFPIISLVQGNQGIKCRVFFIFQLTEILQ